MKRASIVIGIISGLFFWGIQPADSQTVAQRPGFYEELGEALDSLTQTIQDFSGRWRDRFTWNEPLNERPLITLMLRYQDELGLTSEQVRALTQLRADFERESIRKDADLRIAQRDLDALFDADRVDLPQVESKIREIERLRADLRIARIRTIEKGKAELSPEQLAKFQTLIVERRRPRPQPSRSSNST